MPDDALTFSLDLVRYFESCRLTAYQDAAGIWTIGWGETWNSIARRRVQEGDTINQLTADSWLRSRVSQVLEQVQQAAPGATDQQAAAMASLAYNIGVPAFRASTLLRLFLAGDVAGAAGQFLVWDHAHVDGQLVELPGLLKRRQMERSAFLGEVEA